MMQKSVSVKIVVILVKNTTMTLDILALKRKKKKNRLRWGILTNLSARIGVVLVQMMFLNTKVSLLMVRMSVKVPHPL